VIHNERSTFIVPSNNPKTPFRMALIVRASFNDFPLQKIISNYINYELILQNDARAQNNRYYELVTQAKSSLPAYSPKNLRSTANFSFANKYNNRAHFGAQVNLLAWGKMSLN
jgi:hypothetical protein